MRPSHQTHALQKLCTHAAYQFEPEEGHSNYDESNAGSGDAPFELVEWTKRLKQAHSLVKQRMYFV